MAESLAQNTQALDVDPLDPNTGTQEALGETKQPLGVPQYEKKKPPPKLYEVMHRIDPQKLKAMLVKNRSETLIMRNAGPEVGDAILSNPDYASLSYKDKIKMSEKFQTSNLKLIDRIGLSDINSDDFTAWYLTNQNKFTDQERNAALKYRNNKLIKEDRAETYGNSVDEQKRQNTNKNNLNYNIANRSYRGISFDISTNYDATGIDKTELTKLNNELMGLLNADLSLDDDPNTTFMYSTTNKQPIEKIQNKLWEISEKMLPVLKKKKYLVIGDKTIEMPEKNPGDHLLRSMWFESVMHEIDDAKTYLDKVTPFSPPKQQPLTGLEPAVINENSSEEDIQNHFRKKQGK